MRTWTRAIFGVIFLGASAFAVANLGEATAVAQPPDRPEKGGEKGGEKGDKGGKGGKGGMGMGKGMMPKPGTILPPFLIDQLKLTDAQKKQVEDLQKEVDTKLAKILTEDQMKMLKEPRGPGGPGGPGGGPGGPGGGGRPGGEGRPPQE